MSRPLVAAATRVERAAPSFGWYGKSPATGDFISRRLAKATIDRLDVWLQAGMTALRDASPGSWQGVYASAPIWNALLPATLLTSVPSLVVVAPSFDRVGRRFPLCLVTSIDAETLHRIASLPEYCADVSRLVDDWLHVRIEADEVDRRLPLVALRFASDDNDNASALSDITDVLGDAAHDDLTTVPLDAHSAFPWPDLVRSFDPRARTSYWWTSSARGALCRGLTHDGPLDVALFVTLFGRAQGEAHGSWSDRS